jgi:hypothetical protein
MSCIIWLCSLEKEGGRQKEKIEAKEQIINAVN